MKKNRSIRFLLLTALASAFALVLVFTLVYGAKSQRGHMEQFSRQYVDSMAKSYFDALNTMMLTGSIGNRQMLRDKMVAAENVENVRFIRGENIVNTFGEGLPGEQVQGALELQALSGERIERIRQGDNGRVFTLIEPVRAMADYQGVNCIGCHQVPENEVLGAIRIDYSLASSDQALTREMITSSLVQIIIFIFAFGLTAWVLDKMVIKRLRRLHDTMGEIAANADLTVELEVLRDDEIGSVSRAFNRMLSQIGVSMRTVVSHAGQVYDAALVIADKAETTEKEVLTQKLNTDQVASATTQMAASAVEVKGNAVATASHSLQAVEAASNGEQRAKAAVAGIEALNAEVQQGASRIQQLNKRTDDVAVVLEVISSIAEQTNLLALNAAIEAARAGEQGRGFAVVADEVRSLASRTQESTEEIRHTITSLKTEAADCVQIMEHASSLATDQVDAILAVADGLHSIAAAVEDISQLNEQMENAANEQSTVSEMINGNVIEISQSAEQTSGDAQQTARIAEDLRSMATELKQTVGRFRLD